MAQASFNIASRDPPPNNQRKLTICTLFDRLFTPFFEELQREDCILYELAGKCMVRHQRQDEGAHRHHKSNHV